MGVARLPAKTAPAPPNPRQEALQEAIVNHIADGRKPSELAKQLAGGDPKREKALRKRIRRMMVSPGMQEKIAQASQAEMIAGLIPVVQATVRRASRGNPTMARLVLEATGFHNPRVKHEHSGDIEIKLTIPRPELPARADDPGPAVVDAEVVEE